MATTFTNPLDSIKVASPCSADWYSMVGNNRQRHCGDCKLDVYNLSGMTKSEAENLIMNAEGRVCARFFRRADGTVITKDCPVGWQAVKQRMSKFWTAAASIVITAASGIGITAFMTEKTDPSIMGAIAVENTNPPQTDPAVMGEMEIEYTNPPQNYPQPEMGDIAMPLDEHPEVKMGKIAMPTN